MAARSRRARLADVHELAMRIGELTVQELAEVIQDAWLSRASPARATALLDALKALARGWPQAACVIAGRR